jgi:choline dehydrogenase-like flavoprotein
MFKSLRNAGSNAEFSYDLCIIGTGPAGISVAKNFLGSKLKVGMLESGGLNAEAKFDQLNEGKNSGPRYLSLDASRLRCFGGAAGLWAGVCAPFSSDDFLYKPFVPLSGWPIRLIDLRDYYIEAAEMLGISYEKFYDQQFFQNTLNGVSFKEFNRKNSFLSGNVYQVSDIQKRDFGSRYKTEFESSQNIDVLFHSTVTRLNVDATGGQIDSASIADLDGNKAIVRAKHFVLACGALENPRILLASNDHYKEGIGNHSGFVGACFMSHPGIQNVGEVHRSIDELCIDGDRFEDDYVVAFEMSPTQREKQKTLRHSLSMYRFSGLEDPSTYLSGRIFTHFNKIIEKFDFLSSVSESLCKMNGAYIRNKMELGVALEQPPKLTNKVSLDNTKDQLGVPKINVYWGDLTELEKRTVATSVETLARELGVLNMGRVKYSSEFLSGESFKFDDPVNHHIGTTRMSSDPTTGVVDENCKVFGISNLYVTGSSVFSTSSIVNPTYTIIAISLRLAKHLKGLS